MFSGKKIVLGVTGSIAAYKAAPLVRLLTETHNEVRVLMTPSAKRFISPLTLATLSGHEALCRLVKKSSQTWNNHVELGRWGDVMLIAPASAHTLAQMAHGQCDNLLLAAYLSATCTVMVAPAMDADMWTHPATQHNIDTLTSRHTLCIPPRHGKLASGIVGAGRMAEPQDIVSRLDAFFSKKKRLAGKRALVTAGPTHEAIDAVRFVGNHASGKMGFAMAEALAEEGASVTLISGPTACATTHSGITLCRVTSAQDMLEACTPVFSQVDIAVFSAAVADYRPVKVARNKVKKQSDTEHKLALTRTTDIAATLSTQKKPGQLTVGFALETDQGETQARQKQKLKRFDFIALNSLQDPGAGFGHDTNRISLIDPDGRLRRFPLKTKREVAADIVDALAHRYA